MGIIQELKLESELYDVHKMFEDFMLNEARDDDEFSAAETQAQPSLSDGELNFTDYDSVQREEIPQTGEIDLSELTPKNSVPKVPTDTSTVDAEIDTPSDPPSSTSSSTALPSVKSVAEEIPKTVKPIEKGFLFAAYNAVKSTMNEETKNSIKQFLDGVAKTHAGVYNAVKATSERLSKWVPFLPPKWKSTLTMALMFLLIVNGTGIVGGIIPAVLVAKAFAVGRIASFAFKTEEDAKKAKEAAEAKAKTEDAGGSTEVPPLNSEERKETELAVDKAIEKIKDKPVDKESGDTIESKPEEDEFKKSVIAAGFTPEIFKSLKDKIAEYKKSKSEEKLEDLPLTESEEVLFEGVLNEGLRQALRDAASNVGKEIRTKFANAATTVYNSSKTKYDIVMGAINKKADEYVPGWRKMDLAVKNKVITTLALTALGLGVSASVHEISQGLMGATPEQIENNLQHIQTSESPVSADGASQGMIAGEEGGSVGNQVQTPTPQVSPSTDNQASPDATNVADKYDELVPRGAQITSDGVQYLTNTPEYNQLVQDSTSLRLSSGMNQRLVPGYQNTFKMKFTDALQKVASGANPEEVLKQTYPPTGHIRLNDQMAEGILRALKQVSQTPK